MQYLHMKWPLLDVPPSTTVKDTRSPSPAHLVSSFRPKAPKGLPVLIRSPPPRTSGKPAGANRASSSTGARWGLTVRLCPVHALAPRLAPHGPGCSPAPQGHLPRILAAALDPLARSLGKGVLSGLLHLNQNCLGFCLEAMRQQTKGLLHRSWGRKCSIKTRAQSLGLFYRPCATWAAEEALGARGLVRGVQGGGVQSEQVPAPQDLQGLESRAERRCCPSLTLALLSCI